MDMPFLKLLSYFLLLTSFKLASSEVDIPGPAYYEHSCTIDTNLASGSPYQFNSTPEVYITNTIVGTDAAYGGYMCRGEVAMEVCRKCVQDATSRIASVCPNNKEAIIWYDQCLARYSNSSFFSTLRQLPTANSSLQEDMGGLTESRCSDYTRTCEGRSQLELRTQTDSGHTGNNLSDAYRVLNKTLHDAVVEAAAATSSGTKKFATKEAHLSSSESVYTLVQCTPDLSPRFCCECLYEMMERIPKEKTSSRERILNPSRDLRFTRRLFYHSRSKTAVSVPPTHLPTPEVDSSGNTGKDNEHSRTLVIIPESVTVVSIVLCCFGFYYWKRKNNKSAILKKNFGCEGATLESLQFSLAAIEAATDKFSIENRIGKGGFGEVYKGILPDGTKIAVKRLSEHSRQGLMEFKNEVLLIAKLQHRNLVALLGFCLKDQEKLLVYEYVPNKSLDYFLFGVQKQRVLNWPERYKIIRGIAQGILYLHEHSRPKVIHRDLKPSNILLDDEMNPIISDFGMVRMIGIDETRRNTDIIVETLGYMSPEYIKFGLFSDKSDVFSFGVMILEIVSGKNIYSQRESQESQYSDGLLHHILKHWRDENFIEILDSNLTEDGRSHSEITKCIHIGLLCVQGNLQVRPSMNEVVQYLSNDSMEFPIPEEPAFFMHTQMETSRAMEDQLANHNQFSINEISDSIISPR